MPNVVSRWPPWILIVAGPILSLIVFVVSYELNPLHAKGPASAAAIPAFLFSILILLVSHNLNAFKELAEHRLVSDRIYEAVREYLHVTKVGSPVTAWKYVLEQLPKLQEVRNTSLNIEDELERSEDKLYDTASYAGSARKIAQWTERELRWKDIGDSQSVGRLRKIANVATNPAKPLAHYQYRLIAHNEPQINFILLTYPDGTSEVLFNWDFRNIGEDPVVLLSRDQHIVAMFAIQFEHLWRTASQDHDNMATRSTSKK